MTAERLGEPLEGEDPREQAIRPGAAMSDTKKVARIGYHIDAPSLPLPAAISSYIAAEAHRQMTEERQAVERRILAGENTVTVDYSAGNTGHWDRRTIVYSVPPWRSAPLRRLRLAMARRRYQRGDR